MWYMHKGMVRFYRKFFRYRYPSPMMWLVVFAVWARFATLVLLSIGLKLLPDSSSRSREGRALVERVDPLGGCPDPSEAGEQSGAGRSALVTGARSQIGHFLLPQLRGVGYQVRALTRQRPTYADTLGIDWITGDLGQEGLAWGALDGATLIHLAALWLLPRHLEELLESRVMKWINYWDAKMGLEE